MAMGEIMETLGWEAKRNLGEKKEREGLKMPFITVIRPLRFRPYAEQEERGHPLHAASPPEVG